MKRHLAIAIAIGATAGALSGLLHWNEGSDLTQNIRAAEVWLAGGDPYTVRHGPFPLFYPFTAVLLAVPLALGSVPEFWFVGLGIGLYVWAVLRQPRWSPPALLVLLTPAMVELVRAAQWSALMTGAALVPALGFVLACKPTIGAALWIGFPSTRALVGGAVFVLASFVIYPPWPWQWLTALQEMRHIQAPITFWGGPLILLALLRWRHWEARLLLALACVPQSQFYYDLWPLFLIPRTGEQATVLMGLSWAAVALQGQITGDLVATTEAAYFRERFWVGQLSLLLVYFPCLWMVLKQREPSAVNIGPLVAIGPAWRSLKRRGAA